METIHRFSHHFSFRSVAAAAAAAAKPNARLRRCCLFIFPASTSSSFSTSSTAASFSFAAAAALQFQTPYPDHHFWASPPPLISHSRRRCHSDTGRHSGGSPAPSVSSRRRRNVSAEAAGWLSGLVSANKKSSLPEIVKAGDPVLHEPARDLTADEIISDDIQKTIDNMIAVMRMAPGVGLAAPQIGLPLKIIVLEDTKEYISYAPKNEITAQDRRPFDLLVIVNPKLKKKSNKTALFFEGCLSVDGYRAVVERFLEVEVSGLDRHGRPIKVDSTGWQARILQHECDHLEGTIYVDKIVPRTFRIVENLDLPLATGCPKLGVSE